MDSAASAVSGVLGALTSAPVLAAGLALLLAGGMALLVARLARAPRERAATAAAHWLDHILTGALILAPLVAALATLIAGHAVLAAFAVPTAAIDGAVQLVGALLLARLVVYVLCLLLAPRSWRHTRAPRLTFLLLAIGTLGQLRWLDSLGGALNRIRRAHR